MENKILEKYRSGALSIGTFSHLKSMAAIEAIAVSGMDYAIIDREHCPTDVDEMASYIAAAKSGNLTPIVRVPEKTRAAVLTALDAGAMGVIVPCINSAEEVRTLTEYAKFKPLGDRGYCPTFDGSWGYDPCYAGGLENYMKTANENTLLIPQCETLGCLESIEEIAAIPGVDGIMIGPFDLSIALGIPGQFDHADFKKAVARILAACKAAGKISVIFCGNAQAAKAYAAQGFDSVIVSLDLLELIHAMKNIIAEIEG